MNPQLKIVQTEVELRFICVETCKEILPTARQKTTLAPNGTAKVLTGNVYNYIERPHVLGTRLFVDGRVVAREMDWPQPLKYLRFPERNVRVIFSQGQVHATAEKPVKCFVFDEMEGHHFSDNALDLVPGGEQVVTITGLKGTDELPGYIFLGQEEQTQK